MSHLSNYQPNMCGHSIHSSQSKYTWNFKFHVQRTEFIYKTQKKTQRHDDYILSIKWLNQHSFLHLWFNFHFFFTYSRKVSFFIHFIFKQFSFCLFLCILYIVIYLYTVVLDAICNLVWAIFKYISSSVFF